MLEIMNYRASDKKTKQQLQNKQQLRTSKKIFLQNRQKLRTNKMKVKEISTKMAKT